ncbi:serine protease rhomboid 6 isoform X2 [Xylocopa sonorina]|uniref:serine protease rhomboid 6 isoform X2 n=1 Tax=Xylocopa sonorina TaxID=1818115 RepID=UPI00403AC63F
MDAEAALLENSPTLSTISSDCTDTTYSGPGSPYSPESPIIVTLSYKKRKDDEVTPRPTPRHPLPPRKPNFRIRPPYLMICISIIEIAVHCLGDEATLRRWLVYDPRQRVQGWRFASYMLLHSNALHLALNVVIQLVLATPLEVGVFVAPLEHPCCNRASSSSVPQQVSTLCSPAISRISTCATESCVTQAGVWAPCCCWPARTWRHFRYQRSSAAAESAGPPTWLGPSLVLSLAWLCSQIRAKKTLADDDSSGSFACCQPSA